MPAESIPSVPAADNSGATSTASRLPRTLAALIAAVVLALAAAGCGDDNTASEEALPDRPKLTVPDGSVAAERRSSGSTESTGSTGSDTSSSTTTQTDSTTGGAGTDQNTGGQGTGQDQTTTAPQDTGGAAPGQ